MKSMNAYAASRFGRHLNKHIVGTISILKKTRLILEDNNGLSCFIYNYDSALNIKPRNLYLRPLSYQAP